MRLVIKYPVEECYIESAYVLKKESLNGKECFGSHVMAQNGKHIRLRNENIIQFVYMGKPYSVPSEWLEDPDEGELIITDEIVSEYVKMNQDA